MMETLVTYDTSAFMHSSEQIGINPGLIKAVVIRDCGDGECCDITIMDHIDEDYIGLTVEGVNWYFLEELNIKDEDKVDIKVRHNDVQLTSKFKNREAGKPASLITPMKKAMIRRGLI